MYRQIKDDQGNISERFITRITDGAHIPNDPGNRDWKAYQEWLVKGNKPEPPLDN